MKRESAEERLWRIAANVLTDKQWQAFKLRHRYGLSEADIARHLGVTRQAVHERLTAAARKIAAEEQRTRKAA